MKILRATHLGFCFGVRDAIKLAFQYPEPLTILGDLVHNESVQAELRAHAIRIERQPAAIVTPTVMISAHGASERRMAEVRVLGLRVVEATCPLVHAAHRAVGRLVRDGFHPVIIGVKDHVEVRGITEDLQEFDVILTEDDVTRLVERPRFGVAAQTTQPIERVRHLVRLLRHRFPGAEVRFMDTVCQPTKLRQHAATELAQKSDVVIVVGGANSNNTRELVATCARDCRRVHHVTRPDDISDDWFSPGDTVGLTAGTSTPDLVIDAVENRLRQIAVAIDPKPTRREPELAYA